MSLSRRDFARSLATLLCIGRGGRATVRRSGRRPSESPPIRLPGEFERQDGILVGWESRDPIIRHTIIQIVQHASPRLPVIVMVDDDTERRDAAQALQLAGVEPRSIHLIQIPCDTIWVRDFGPVSIEVSKQDSFEFLNLKYGNRERPNDDVAPHRVARFFDKNCRRIPLSLEGGNLLSNGQGVIATTSRVLDQNPQLRSTYRDVVAMFQHYLGCDQPVLLEPLEGEPTGHIDMFATFPSPDTVIVGQYSRKVDPVNADRLDRNAERLARVEFQGRCLQVERIPMPERHDANWPSYTNVLYANGHLLVPVYSGTDGTERRRALALYERLLPDWKLIPIDCTELIGLGGALHCISMNLGQIRPPHQDH